MARKLVAGDDFTFDDFLAQMAAGQADGLD